MNTITVDKANLLATVTANRDAHRQQFLDAQKRYREKVIELLDQRLAEARDGRPIVRAFDLPEPVDYTAEYDRALTMLQWELGDTIQLEEAAFGQLVMNQWRWAQHFAANTSVYLTE